MKYLFLAILVTSSIATHAQNQLVFTRLDTTKAIVLQPGDLVRLGFNGYMKQAQEADGKVTAVTDSTVTVAGRKRFLQKPVPAQTILINDITGFRKFSKARPAAEIIYGIVGIGITGTVAGVLSSRTSSKAGIILSTAATAAVTTALKNLLFPRKIKNHVPANWNVQSVSK